MLYSIIHTGETELDGDDVTGIAVAIGARVGAIARPSEVLVSQTISKASPTGGDSMRPRAPPNPTPSPRPDATHPAVVMSFHYPWSRIQP